jgi:peptidyl-prolyl cis-trans isomerase C
VRPRKRFLVLAAAVSLAACGRCGRRPPPPSVPPAPSIVDAVAIVDGEVIPPAALDRGLREVSAAPGEVDPAVRRQVVADLVDRVLLVREARARNLVPTPEQVDRALDALRAQYPGPRFDEMLAQQGLTLEELRGRTRERLAAERLLVSVAGEPGVTDDEIAAYYEAHRAEFDRPAEVHALQIVLRSREEAQRIRGELRRDPRRFEEVARRVSTAPEAVRGGDLGWFAQGAGMPEAFDVCFTLPAGRVSDVVASPYGFHVFKVLERRPARRRALPEVSGAIREQLLRERRSQAQAAFLEKLRGQAKIELK